MHPVEDSPAGGSLVEDNLAGGSLVEGSLAGGSPVEDSLVEDSLVVDSLVKDSPAEDSLVEDSSAEDSLAGNILAVPGTLPLLGELLLPFQFGYQFAAWLENSFRERPVQSCIQIICGRQYRR